METICHDSFRILVLVFASVVSTFAQELNMSTGVFQTQQGNSDSTNYKPFLNPIDFGIGLRISNPQHRAALGLSLSSCTNSVRVDMLLRFLNISAFRRDFLRMGFRPVFLY